MPSGSLSRALIVPLIDTTDATGPMVTAATVTSGADPAGSVRESATRMPMITAMIATAATPPPTRRSFRRIWSAQSGP